MQIKRAAAAPGRLEKEYRLTYRAYTLPDDESPRRVPEGLISNL
jgi:hypothetical protein